jgi:hypothetical protein
MKTHESWHLFDKANSMYTLAQYVAENKKQVVFEINAKKKRVRARAEKSLESATECGKVDAGRAARPDFFLDAPREE